MSWSQTSSPDGLLEPEEPNIGFWLKGKAVIIQMLVQNCLG